MSSGEIFHSLLLSAQAQCHHTSYSSNSTSPLSWNLWSPSRCPELQRDGNRPETNSWISSILVSSDPAHFSLLKMSVAVCEAGNYEGLHWRSVWRHLSRRKDILPSKISTYTCYGISYSFRISCISFRIDVLNICRLFRTQRYTFPFTVTLYTGNACHSVRMSVNKIMMCGWPCIVIQCG